MNNNFTHLLCFLCLLLLAPQLWAQKLEAENATLSGGAARVACSTCSGGFAVEQKEGNLAFSASIAQEGFYNIILNAAAPGGEKTNIITVNGVSADFYLAKNNQYQNHKIVNTLKLPAGQHTIEIKKSWGWINIDYIELEKVAASDRFNLNQTLVTPNPTPEATALYNFLLDNYGDKIISGVMTLSSMDEVNWLKQNTGKEPALVGLDFMHSGRAYNWYNDKEPIQDAKACYDRNGIPALMWHWRDPLRTTEEFYTQSSSKPEGTTFDISRISDPNSAEYKAMLADIDFISGLLKELQDQHVPVIWRPLHEAAGGWFWWGANGHEPLKALWHLMYDRMVNHHGLRNLIWVWTREPGDEAWYPGDEYVDIVGRDIYKDGDHSSHAIEFNNMNALYGGKKMITLSEVGSFPDVDNLIEDGAGWSWYMPWYGGYTRDSFYNSLSLWRKMFAHEYVITLDEMPDLKTYERQDPAEPEQPQEPEEPQQPTGINDQKHSFKAYPTLIDRDLYVEGESLIKSIAVYNTLGVMLRHQNVYKDAAIVSFAGLNAGLYIVKVNGEETLKVVKK
ncbi:glycosyl hydrolase [Cesiribacter sp. SM1]|uniref:glycosyl hydrolase n=1 Tax=Cesiribacter sp. SM1 TaxID=2861196 RepID=UPI001CD790FB|nr:glycosyl hydrolase [Cesiribacter sp. SM1]